MYVVPLLIAPAASAGEIAFDGVRGGYGPGLAWTPTNPTNKVQVAGIAELGGGLRWRELDLWFGLSSPMPQMVEICYAPEKEFGCGIRGIQLEIAVSWSRDALRIGPWVGVGFPHIGPQAGVRAEFLPWRIGREARVGVGFRANVLTVPLFEERFYGMEGAVTLRVDVGGVSAAGATP